MSLPEDDSVGTKRLGSRPADHRPDAAFLVVLAGAAIGQAHRLGATTIIGRDPTSTIPILEDGISRFHARIDLDAGGVFIEDTGSTNGTFVNGRVLDGRLALRDGDKISLGSTTILKFSPLISSNAPMRHSTMPSTPAGIGSKYLSRWLDSSAGGSSPVADCAGSAAGKFSHLTAFLVD